MSLDLRLFTYIDYFCSMLSQLTFAQPYFLCLLLCLPLLAWHRHRQHRRYAPTLTLSDSGFAQQPNYQPTWRARLFPYLWVWKLAAAALLIVALARPQNRYAEEKITADGIDIIISMDVSGSMLARDFEPDRLGAAKAVAREFVQNRHYDRIGLVVFAGESFTQCPTTTDHKVLETLLDHIRSGMIADGTAIGMGLATAVTRLQDSPAKSKVIILLTDGVNNAGFFDPLTAAETARQYGIKVYTIGIGTEGLAPYPLQGVFGITYQPMEVQIDEKLLREIADATGGNYYRATDNERLRQIYAEIDRLEKSKIEVTTVSRYAERFYAFAFAAICCLLLHLFLRVVVFRAIL